MTEINVTIDDDVGEQWQRLRRDKSDTICAIVLMVNQAEEKIQMDKDVGDDGFFQDTTIEDVAEELEQSEPRFIVFSYVWQITTDRKRFPLLFVHYNPEGVSPQLNMFMTGAKKHVLAKFQGISYHYDIREQDELDEEFLLATMNRRGAVRY